MSLYVCSFFLWFGFYLHSENSEQTKLRHYKPRENAWSTCWPDVSGVEDTKPNTQKQRFTINKLGNPPHRVFWRTSYSLWVPVDSLGCDEKFSLDPCFYFS